MNLLPGKVTATDVDAGESGFTASTKTGAYGSLSIDALGNWTYSANNTQSVIQELGAGDTLTDILDRIQVDILRQVPMT